MTPDPVTPTEHTWISAEINAIFSERTRTRNAVINSIAGLDDVIAARTAFNEGWNLGFKRGGELADKISRAALESVLEKAERTG